MAKCKACLVYCMDFRLHESLANFFAQQKLDGAGADVIRVGGAIKSLAQPKEIRDREFLLEQLNVAYELHGVRQFYLINHEDCGAYGLVLPKLWSRIAFLTRRFSPIS